MAGKTRQQGREVAHHICIDAASQLPPSLFIRSGTSPHRLVQPQPTLKAGSSYLSHFNGDTPSQTGPEVCPLSDSRACRGNNQDQTLRGISRIIDFTIRYTLALGAYQVALNEGWTWVSEIMIGSWLVTNVPSMTY